MRVAFFTNSISVHQIPLALEICALIGFDNYRYIYTGDNLQGGAQEVDAEKVEQLHVLKAADPEALEWCEQADVLLYDGRDIDLFERRSKLGLMTFCTSERWFKPILGRGISRRLGVCLPGWVRMLVPSYRRMARRFVRLVNEVPVFWYLPAGVWAMRDLERIGARKEKMRMWGYFVAPSSRSAGHEPLSVDKDWPLRVLWVGRMLDWKRPMDVKHACELTGGCELTMRSGVSLEEVRRLMQSHDVCVLSSNAYEGWGAVVSEAMEEGMLVLGTDEAGASATLLPPTHRYPAGDVKALAELLRQAREGLLPVVPIGDWSAKKAAERFVKYAQA